MSPFQDPDPRKDAEGRVRQKARFQELSQNPEGTYIRSKYGCE